VDRSDALETVSIFILSEAGRPAARAGCATDHESGDAFERSGASGNL
jgi:hypothetical protein